MVVGGVIAFVSWLATPPRHRGPSQTFNIETGQIETQTTDHETRLNGGLGFAFGSLLVLAGKLYQIDRD